MAETNKTYINAVTLKEKVFESGGSITKFSVRLADFIEQLKPHVNEKGYVNLCISKRKTVGKYGETHCLWVDTWTPSLRPQEPREQSAGVPSQATQRERPQTQPEDDGTLPF